MSGAYSVFPLRLVVVFKLTTTSIRNTFRLFVTVRASVQFGHFHSFLALYFFSRNFPRKASPAAPAPMGRISSHFRPLPLELPGSAGSGGWVSVLLSSAPGSFWTGALMGAPLNTAV